MQTKEYTTRVAAGWPKGPWDDEPTKVQWSDEATGLPCLAVRHALLGQWCGYVGVPPEHPWAGRPYDDDAVNVDVHGGLTFAGPCHPGESEATGICHVPEPGESENVWWLGFDCGHYRDSVPGLMSVLDRRPGDIYRTLKYVKHECARLAFQLYKRGVL